MTTTTLERTQLFTEKQLEHLFSTQSHSNEPFCTTPLLAACYAVYGEYPPVEQFSICGKFFPEEHQDALVPFAPEYISQLFHEAKQTINNHQLFGIEGKCNDMHMGLMTKPISPHPIGFLEWCNDNGKGDSDIVLKLLTYCRRRDIQLRAEYFEYKTKRLERINDLTKSELQQDKAMQRKRANILSGDSQQYVTLHDACLCATGLAAYVAKKPSNIESYDEWFYQRYVTNKPDRFDDAVLDLFRWAIEAIETGAISPDHTVTGPQQSWTLYKVRLDSFTRWCRSQNINPKHDLARATHSDFAWIKRYTDYIECSDSTNDAQPYIVTKTQFCNVLDRIVEQKERIYFSQAPDIRDMHAFGIFPLRNRQKSYPIEWERYTDILNDARHNWKNAMMIACLLYEIRPVLGMHEAYDNDKSSLPLILGITDEQCESMLSLFFELLERFRQDDYAKLNNPHGSKYDVEMSDVIPWLKLQGKDFPAALYAAKERVIAKQDYMRDPMNHIRHYLEQAEDVPERCIKNRMWGMAYACYVIMGIDPEQGQILNQHQLNELERTIHFPDYQPIYESPSLDAYNSIKPLYDFMHNAVILDALPPCNTGKKLESATWRFKPDDVVRWCVNVMDLELRGQLMTILQKQPTTQKQKPKKAQTSNRGKYNGYMHKVIDKYNERLEEGLCCNTWKEEINWLEDWCISSGITKNPNRGTIEKHIKQTTVFDMGVKAVHIK